MTSLHSLGLTRLTRPRSLGIAHFIFAAVLLIRLAALTRLSSSAFALPVGGDMSFYHDWARRILHGQLTDHLAFYGLPLYAYFLAFVYLLFGPNPFVPALVQVTCDAGTAVLLYQLSVRVFSPPLSDEEITPRAQLTGPNRGKAIGLLAAAGWILFEPAQACSIILMPTTLGVFAFWLLVWEVVKRDQAPGPRVCLAYGLLVGFSAMAVATILFILPLILAAIFLKIPATTLHYTARRRRLIATGALFVGVTLGTAPCWLHNRFVAHDPVFLSSHSGINFWIGNNPDANGYPRFPAGLRAEQVSMLEDSTALAEAATGRSLRRAEVSAYWSHRATTYIVSHPAGWAKLILWKVANFWNAFQYDDLGVINRLRELGVIVPGLRFGLVAALGLAGALCALPQNRTSRWVAVAVLLQMAAVLPVFVTERYRLAAVPGLFIFGGFGLWAFCESCIMGAWALPATYISSLALAALLISAPRTDPSLFALDAYASGWQALEAGDLDRADRQLHLAHAYVPDNAETNFALGNLRVAQHDPTRARSCYEAVLRYAPNHKRALNNLGLLELDQNQPAGAAQLFARAAALSPRDAKAHYLLAKALWATGERHQAESEITRAIELDPQQPDFTKLKSEIDTRDREPAP